MIKRASFWTLMMAVAAMLAACQRAAEKPSTVSVPDMATTRGDDCVRLAPGMYYFDGTGLVAQPAGTLRPAPVPDMPPALTPPPQAFSSGWAGDVERALAGQGYPWARIKITDRIALISGTAPNNTARDRALLASENAIRNKQRSGASYLIVDAIDVDGIAGPLGGGVVRLLQAEASLPSCQEAFNTTMQGRTIQFPSNQAMISPASNRLLDALTGVALICRDFQVEIGGHTDNKGSDEYNLTLSQLRADSVREYLIQRGVEASSVKAVGYGESQPIDPRETVEAFARNRRTEFKVTPRR